MQTSDTQGCARRKPIRHQQAVLDRGLSHFIELFEGLGGNQRANRQSSSAVRVEQKEEARERSGNVERIKGLAKSLKLRHHGQLRQYVLLEVLRRKIACVVEIKQAERQPVLHETDLSNHIVIQSARRNGAVLVLRESCKHRGQEKAARLLRETLTALGIGQVRNNSQESVEIQALACCSHGNRGGGHRAGQFFLAHRAADRRVKLGRRRQSNQLRFNGEPQAFELIVVEQPLVDARRGRVVPHVGVGARR